MKFFLRPQDVRDRHGFFKCLLIMKLTLGLLLFFNFNVLADVFSQTKVTLNLKSVDFQKVLSEIEAKTDYRFVFSNRNIPSGKRVDIQVQDAEVSGVLDKVLDNSGFTYNILENNLIVIVPEGDKLNAVAIKGRVLDESGQPLPGASVKVKGLNQSTSTDANGMFSLNVADDATLIVTFVGYETKEVAVKGQASLTITLSPSANNLKEVVVTSLGIQRAQKSLGYAVSTISSKQLTESGNTNFASAMYGKAAGVRVTTAPGGASSAVNVQIRGVNSLHYNQQPLYVVDGVMIRNNQQFGSAGANNNNYWDDQRIRGNGILDVNPNDIETLTVLKGASATALYGSDAASGVIVITTKKGVKGKGMGVDFNYYGTVENVAFLPKFQNVYGPGYDRATNLANGATEEGWIPGAPAELNGGLRPYFRAYGQFGPKMEGQQVQWWDGSVRSYTAQEDNYKDVYQAGYSSNFNLALSNQSDKLNYRLSANRLDYKGTQPGNKMEKNTFNLNSTLKLGNKISTDIVVNYINTINHNRPYQLGQVLGSFGGYFSRAEDMSLLKQKSQTSDGYKYVTYDHPERSSEAFIYNIRATNLMDFFWQQERNTYDETENRLLTSATVNWDLVRNFKLRGRIGGDYTTLNTENKQYNEYPVAFNAGQSTGGYNIAKGQYSIIYGDVLATYSNKVGSDFTYSGSAGFQSRSEYYTDQYTGTYQGLITENWFTLNNSYGQLDNGTGNPNNLLSKRQELLKYAYLGMVNLGYKDFLFLEGTARQEYSSTLPAKNNSYFYPSVNAGFVFSDAFRVPKFLSYGKLRASYGVVGNSAPIYRANTVFAQTPLQTVNGAVPSMLYDGSYGNGDLTDEKKYEQEIGLEAKFLNNRLGVDISYYDNKVKNQIFDLSLPSSVGAVSQIVNLGEIGSRGIELALNATPLSGKFRWDTRLNFSTSRTKVNSLPSGVNEIVFYTAEQNTVKIVAGAGDRLGNIYATKRAQDENGNYIINDDGLYVIDKSNYVKVGNVLPKAVGGFSNTLAYKNFSLDFTLDYSFGSKMVSAPTKYMTAAGMFESTMQYRDAAHGGLTYTENGKTYDDGVLLQGVNQNSGDANSKIISAATYYFNTFNWGEDTWSEKGSVYDNSYIKMRETVLSYRLPASISSKMHVSNLRLSVIGRNLFYVWRTLENLDPEAPLGNKWWSQGVDVGSTAASRSFGFSLNANF